MLAWLLLVGFVPWQSTVVPTTGADLPVGAPAPHLRRDRALALRHASTSRWQSFRDAWGPGWAARWDHRTGLPRFLWAPGVWGVQADALVDDIARLAGIDPAELTAAKSVNRSDRTWLRWRRVWRG